MDGYKSYAAVILIQAIHTGFYVISKASFDKGVSTFVFVFYRQATASLLLVPVSFILERYIYIELHFQFLLFD